MIVCTSEGCTEPAVSRVSSSDLSGPPIPGLGFVIVRPAATWEPGAGMPLCLEHTHHAVGLMLLRAMPGAAA
jgi:hypothetical protein